MHVLAAADERMHRHLARRRFLLTDKLFTQRTLPLPALRCLVAFLAELNMQQGNSELTGRHAASTTVRLNTAASTMLQQQQNHSTTRYADRPVHELHRLHVPSCG